jgi:hypothetical protein
VYWWQLNGTNISQLVDSANFTGANSNVLTVLNATSNDLGTYQLMVTNNYGMAVSSNAVLTLVQKYLVGRWIGGTNSDLTDLSGFSPTGTHDGYDIANSGGAYYFTNDVPPGRTGVSLYVSNDGIAINNSSTLDAAYTNTFDATINNAMSVAFWARGWPGGWNPFVSKNGDSGSPNAGWDIRNDGNDNTSPCFTCRGAGGTVNLGTAVYGNAEDMAATSLTYGNDNKWHHYASTFNAASGTRYLWVDGKIAASASGVHAYNLASYAHVVLGGIDHSPGNTFAAFFTGKLYDVRIYNYDLSSNEVQVLSALPDPLINPQPPAALTGFVGLTAQISAVETGTAPLTNQWQWNGANLTDGPFNGATITGSTSNVLTIANLTTSVQGVFHLVLSNPKGLTISSNTVLSVYPTAPQPAANLVGEWLSGVTNLTDTSGYSPAGTHDGYGALAGGGPSPFYAFTNDVPSGQVGYSLVLSSGTTGIAISNSSSLDANYTNTFDNQINTSMTVECWAKGCQAVGIRLCPSLVNPNPAGSFVSMAAVTRAGACAARVARMIWPRAQPLKAPAGTIMPALTTRWRASAHCMWMDNWPSNRPARHYTHWLRRHTLLSVPKTLRLATASAISSPAGSTMCAFSTPRSARPRLTPPCCRRRARHPCLAARQSSWAITSC